MGWPSRSGPAGRPISAPLRSQAAPRPGGTCPRPAARLHLLPGATARVSSSLIKPVPAAPGGTCPPGSRPASTCNRALQPAWRLRSTSRARSTWGDVLPGSRPAPTCHRALRLAWSLHPSKLVLASLGGTSPPARGPHLLATRRYGPRGVFTHQAGRSAPPTAARPRSVSLVVVTRRSRLATSRDYPRERPLPVTLSSRWTSRREEEEGGT